MPDGNAIRPGDVLTSMSGQTIEVLNTDAEGRLVLSDAIAWVQKTHRPKDDRRPGDADRRDDHRAGPRTRRPVRQRRRAGRPAAGGRPRRRAMRCGDCRSAEAYNKLIDSPIADMKNVGPRAAGSITAAQFIARFVDAGRQMGAPRHRRHGVVGQARRDVTTRARPAMACGCSTASCATRCEG